MFEKRYGDGEFCPLVKGSCLRHTCAFFTKLIGMNPQTGQPVDEFKCAVSFLPILLVENSNQQRQTAASVDKVANQINRSRAEFLGALPEEARERLVQNNVRVLEEKKAG